MVESCFEIKKKQKMKCEKLLAAWALGIMLFSFPSTVSAREVTYNTATQTASSNISTNLLLMVLSKNITCTMEQDNTTDGMNQRNDW